MRAMGIDYGEVRIGIALSDEMKILATPYETYNQKNKTTDETIEYFMNIINEKKVDEIVIGLPLNMKGEEQDIAIKTREFALALSNVSKLNPIFIDERLTSVLVNRIMNETNMSWQDRKKVIDKMSAAAILQTYLERIRSKNG